MKRATAIVAALALLVLIAFLLHRAPPDQKPRPLPGRRPAAETAAETTTSPPLLAAPPAAAPRPAPEAIVSEALPRVVPGSLRGVVKLKGPVPPRKMQRTSADPNCEAMHGPRMASDEFVVDPYGNVQWAFVYVKSGPIGTPPPAPATPVYLDQVSCVFTPHVVGIRVGQPLIILNSDNLLHNAHAIALVNKEFNFGLPKAGMQEKKSFDKVEVMFPIKCDVHPWMKSWIGVLDHPYFSITNAVGSYRIAELPPGRYTVEVWHEKCARVSFLVEVPSGGETVLDFWLDVKTD